MMNNQNKQIQEQTIKKHKYTYCLVLKVAFIFLTSSIARAGGISWLVSIENLEKISDTTAIIELDMNPHEHYVINNCQNIKVYIDYKPESILRRTWTEKLVDKEKHKKALSYIEQAYENNQNIRFGSIGEGLYPYSSYNHNSNNLIQKILYVWKEGRNRYNNKNCEFQSKGISLMEEGDGNRAVYSFYGAI